jgi:hypothetical protein
MTKHAESVPMTTHPESDAGAPEITPAMIAAGVYAARDHCLGEQLEELVRKVYMAMALET